MSVAEAWKPTEAEYFADTERISCSMLKVFMRSRREFEAHFLTGTLERPEPTEAMQLGTLLHRCVFESGFTDRLVAMPKFDGRTNAGKAAKAEFYERNIGRAIVSMEQMNSLVGMLDALKRNKRASRLLYADGPAEEVLTAQCEETFLALKGRLDKRIPECIVDLKACSEPSEADFASQCARLKYYCQAHWYQNLVEENFGATLPFVFVCVQPEPPYRIGLFEMHADAIALGRSENRRALFALKTCFEEDNFSEPAESEIVSLRLPRWAEYQSAQWQLSA